MINMEPKIVYRRSGENLEFINDCLATQIEAIIKKLKKGCQSDPKFWSLTNNQKRPQNKAIMGKLKTREWSDPRLPIPPRNEQELQKGGRGSPKFLDSSQHRRGFKNEMIDEELERRGRSHSRVWILKTDQKELRNQTSWELEKSSHNNPKLLDLIRIQKRSKNEVPKKELKEKGHDHQRFWISKKHQEKPRNMNSLELEKGCLSDHGFLDLIKNKKRSKNEMINKEEGLSHHRFWITKGDQVEFQNKTSWELKGRGYNSNEFWIPRKHQELQNTTSLGLQNKTSWELEGQGYNSNEFWIHKRLQKKPQNTNSLGLEKGGQNHPRFLDFMKNTKRSGNGTVDLEGKVWRGLETNVLYSIYCTVQYPDEATTRSRIGFPAVVIKVDTSNHYSKARFADTDIEGSLMMDMFYTEIYEKQIIIQESEVDFPTVAIRAHIDDSEIYVRTKMYEIDYMGATPYTDLQRILLRRIKWVQEVSIAEDQSFHDGSNVDREVDTDGDGTVFVLQWPERRDTERFQCQANQITFLSEYFVVQEIEVESGQD